MNDQFELRVDAVLREYADLGVRPIDRRAIAAAAIAAGRPRFGIGAPWATAGLRRRLVLVSVASLTLALLAAALLLSGGPRDDRILAIVHSDGLYFADADGAGERRVLAGQFGNVAWSPDGLHLVLAATAYDVPDPRLVIVDRSGMPIASALAAQAQAPVAWSRDGTRLLTGQVVGERGLAEGVGIDDAGASLAFIDRQGVVSRTGPLPTEGDRLWRGALTLDWRADGAWAIADIRRERNLCHELVLVPSAPNGETVLFKDGEATLDCAAHRPAWTSDGSRIAILHAEGEPCWPWTLETRCAVRLAVYDVADAGPPLPVGTPTVVTDDADLSNQPLWLPDGEGLLFARRLPSPASRFAEVAVVAADGSGERSIAQIETSDLRLSWFTPGVSVLYRSGAASDFNPDSSTPYSGELHRLDLATGNDRVLATDVVAAAMQP